MCTTCSLSIDQTKVDAFSQQFLTHTNGAAVILMISIGHRTGLFDAMSDGEPLTSLALAEKAGLSERYVREWLGAMTTGGVVEYDPDARTYRLPPEHSACLTRAAAPNNLASISQWLGVLGSVEDRVVEAFRHGRGVPYDAYGRFHEVMAEESGQTTVAALDTHIIPFIDGLHERLTQGIDVADVGCGRGMALLHLAATYPNSRFVGIDLSRDATAAANADAKRRGLANIRFEQHDATTWDAKGSFDLIFAFDAIHDQARPDLVLRNIALALRRGGVFLMQDIKASSHVEKNADLAMGPFIYTISCMHCMSVSLAQGGMGLGAAWGTEKALTMLKEAGFERVRVDELPHDIQNVYYECRR